MMFHIGWSNNKDIPIGYNILSPTLYYDDVYADYKYVAQRLFHEYGGAGCCRRPVTLCNVRQLMHKSVNNEK